MNQLFNTYQGQALLAGAVIGIVQLVASWILLLPMVSGWLKRLDETRLPAAIDPHLVHKGLELVWALGAPLLVLFLGIFSTQDIGIPLPDWQLVLPWTAVTVAAALVLLVWLWGRHWRQYPSECPAPGRTWRDISPAYIIMHALCQEGYLATTRGALIPLGGNYWGIWVGVLAKIAFSLASHRFRRRLLSARERDLALLDWSCDLLSSALFVLTRSLAVTVIARLLLNGVLSLAAVLLPRRVELSE
ncbi:MAG: hypothetical protein GXY52_08740 [Chloroflexi bacterium]|nr:hypothetical protein [Chloroflexota bacterium]